VSGKLNYCDCAIIGGGAIGLSIAYELVSRGREVTIFDRIEPGKETSWAGAGILPPAPTRDVSDPLDQLRQLAMTLHPQWAARLQAQTGIDTGFRQCGAIYTAFSPGEHAALKGFEKLCTEQGIDCRLLSSAEAIKLEPNLQGNRLKTALELPGECQLRNPRYLKALIKAEELSGGQIATPQSITAVVARSAGGWDIVSNLGRTRARSVCVAAGAWSQQILHSLGLEFSIFPVRGQIVLYRCRQPPFKRILNIGPRYLVPRDDGRVLVGSTEEEVGFDKRTTDEAITDLKSLAESLVPALRDAEVERTWAGLRPASFDSLPYMGEAPGHAGLFVATGHFRSGLYLSPAVGSLMADLICGQPPIIDPWPFRLSRR
jgi:glycine oxidase